MILDDVTSFWWENITGPQMLVERVAAHLLDGKSVVLQLNTAIPWREQLRDFIAHRLEQVPLRPLNWRGGCAKAQIVPELLDRLYRSGASVCPTAYRAQLKYLKNEGIFAHCVVWISSAGDQDLSGLLQFLSDYQGKDLQRHGAFVLEVPESQSLPSLSDSCVVLRCGDHIRRSDLLLFASILADSNARAQELKGYMACAAANLAGQDAELIPEILHRVDFEQEDPGEALSRLWDEGSIPCPDRRPDGQELQMRVWAAQLQSAFALIELERLRIAEEYGELIEESLTAEYWEPKWDRTGFIRQRNDELGSASDVELGTLVRMMSLRRNDDRAQPLLSFPGHELQGRIIFLTECRNNLAHHRVCTPDQMYGLLCFNKDN